MRFDNLVQKLLKAALVKIEDFNAHMTGLSNMRVLPQVVHSVNYATSYLAKEAIAAFYLSTILLWPGALELRSG